MKPGKFFHNFFGHLHTINTHKLEGMKNCFRVCLYKQGLLHDLSKYSFSEFIPSIYFDTEASGGKNGRADGLGVEDRTKCAVAFCEEVKAQGYKPGVYASTLWFRQRVDLSRLTGYSIWNAHYGVASSPISCDMWQGSCTARIPGYGGQIDVNISYVG